MSQLSRDLKHTSRPFKWMAFLISGLLFLLPFILIPGFGSYIALRYFVFGTFALILFVLAVLLCFRHPWITAPLRKSWPVYGLAAYLAAYILTSLTSTDSALSFFSTFQRADGGFTLIFLMLFAFSVFTAIRLGGQETVYRFVRYSAFGAALFSILIMLSPDGLAVFEGGIFEKSRGGATIGNSSLAVFYVVWNVFFAGLLLLRSPSTKKKIWWAVALLIMLASPLFINWHLFGGDSGYAGITSLIGSARGGLLGLLTGFLIAVGVWLATDARKMRIYLGRGLIMAIAAAMAISGTLLLQKSSALHHKFIEAASGTRFIFWDSAVAGFKERPVLGFGPGTFSTVFHKYFNPDIFLSENSLELLVDRPHNIFFETLVGGGVVLFAALCAFLAAIIFILAQLARHKRLLGALLLGGFVAWLLQMQFIFDSVASLALLFLVIGIGLAGGGSEEKERGSRVPVSTAGTWVMTLVIALALFLFIYAIFLPMRKARVMFGVRDMTLPARADSWQRLSGISPMGDDYDSVLVFANAFSSYIENAKRLRSADPALRAAAIKELDAIEEYLSDLLKSGGEKYELLFVAAQIHYAHILVDPTTSMQTWESAHALATRALELSPTDPRPRKLLEQLEALRQ
jgi:O-antigen ligase